MSRVVPAGAPAAGLPVGDQLDRARGFGAHGAHGGGGMKYMFQGDLGSELEVKKRQRQAYARQLQAQIREKELRDHRGRLRRDPGQWDPPGPARFS